MKLITYACAVLLSTASVVSAQSYSGATFLSADGSTYVIHDVVQKDPIVAPFGIFNRNGSSKLLTMVINPVACNYQTILVDVISEDASTKTYEASKSGFGVLDKMAQHLCLYVTGKR